MNPQPNTNTKSNTNTNTKSNIKIVFDKSPIRRKYLFQQKQGFVYLHQVGVNQFHSFNVRQVNFSRTLHFHSLTILKMLKEYDDTWWAVLPIYIKQSANPNIICIQDVQLTLTGGIQVEKGQTALQATIRQSKQEIGLNVAGQKIIGLGQNGELIISENREKKIYVSIIPIENLKQQNINLGQTNDAEQSDSKERMQTWVLIKDVNDPIFLKRGGPKLVALLNVKLLLNLLQSIFSKQCQGEVLKIQNNQKFYQSQKQISSGEQSEDCSQIEVKNINNIQGEEQFWTKEKSLQFQEKLKKMQPQQIEKYINQKKETICILAQVPFGNYVFQVLCELCNKAQIEKILKLIAPNFLMIVRSNQGTHSCQKLIKAIVDKKSAQLIRFTMKLTYKFFYEIAKTRPGSYFLRNLIQNFPITEIMKLKGKFRSKNQKDFKQLVSSQFSVFVAEAIIIKAEAASMDNNQKAIRLKYKFIKRLKNCFLQVTETSAYFLIQLLYQVLTPKDMQPITILIFNNFYEILQYNQRKCCNLIAMGFAQRWRHPFYHKYYHQLVNQLSKLQIKGLYHQKQRSEWVLRQILKMPGQFQIKIKIANAILDEPNPQFLNVIPQKVKIHWKGKRFEALNKFKQNYVKTQKGWVLKKMGENWLNFQKMEQEHQEMRIKNLKKCLQSSIKQPN